MQELAGYVCEQPVKALDCANKYDTSSTAMRRWYYNMALDKCEEFVFGGCLYTLADGNQNNFASKKDCVARCKHYRPNSFTTSTSYAWASTTTPATLCPVELPEYDDITGTTASPDQRRLSAKRCDKRCQSMNMVGVFKRRPTKDGCWYTCKCECPKPIKRKKCKRKCKKQGYDFTWHPTFLYSGQGGSYEEDPYRCKKVCACDGKYQGVVGQKTPDDPENPSSLASLLTGDHPKKKARNML